MHIPLCRGSGKGECGPFSAPVAWQATESRNDDDKPEQPNRLLWCGGVMLARIQAEGVVTPSASYLKGHL